MDPTDVRTDASPKDNAKPLLKIGARLGYLVLGLIHLLLAWIALRVAFGKSGGSADQSGALATLGRSTGGAFLLWVVVAGFALLALWQALSAAFGWQGTEAKDRAKAGGKAVLYAALAFTALKFAVGAGTSSRQQTKDFTATAMQHSGGRILVVVVGLVVLGAGAFHVYKGWASKFLEDLEEHPGDWAVWAGRVGYVAKGIALALVGVLFVIAGVRKAPSKATGLDGALRTLREAPAGTWLLAIVAVGIAAYGIYCFARARYAKI